MDNRVKVSILIPVYNRANIILETLNSAVSQTIENIEVIVVDNKSTDNTYAILQDFARSHPNVKVYQNETNLGPVRNWRNCLDYSTGEYVKILWSDDLIAPDYLEKTLPFLENNENVGFVFTGSEVFYTDSGKRAEENAFGDTGLYDTKIFIEGSLLGGSFPVSPGCALFRKHDLDKNLLVDVPNKIGSDFKMHAIGNDVLMFLLTAKDYSQFAFINEPLSFFRAHKESITISSDKKELVFLYHIAKAYFVENYVEDKRLLKRFNAKLSIMCLKKKFGAASMKDFYFDETKRVMSIPHFLALLVK